MKGEGLDLRAAKGGVIPFIGLVEVEFNLSLTFKRLYL